MRKPRHERRRDRKPAGSGPGSFATLRRFWGRVNCHSKSRRTLPLFSWLRLTGAGLSGASLPVQSRHLRSDAAILAGPRLHTLIAFAKAPNHHTILKLGHAICREEHKDGPRWEMRGFVFTLTVLLSHQQPLRSGLALH